MSQSSSLTPSITQLVLDLAKIDRISKKAEARKKELRSELFHVATLENEKQVLPRKTFRLPVHFLNQIGMQENIFLSSRYPGWRKIESRKVNEDGEASRDGEWIEYLIERDPATLPWKIEVETESGMFLSAGRQIQQKSPEIDQRTLQKDLPEVFHKIMKPKVTYEVDVEKLETLISEEPELLPRLELHFAYPEPVTKLASIKEREPDG